MSPGSPISPEIVSGKAGENESSNSSITIDTGILDSRETGGCKNILPPHPLDQPGIVKIALGESASAALKSLGQHLLVIAAPADATAPEELRGRYVLHCLPLTMERADAAYRAATGRKRKPGNS